MGRLLLVRHGESEGNRDRIFTRTPAVPITVHGRQQAREAGEMLQTHFRPQRLVSSPFVRARQTADIIGELLDLVPDVVDEFRERSYGELAGQPYDTPRPDYDPASYWRWCPPGGETLEQVAQRVGRALDAVAASVPHGDAVVVSHGGVMMALWRHVTGAWSSRRQVTRNAGIVLVEHEAGVYRVARAFEPDVACGVEHVRR